MTAPAPTPVLELKAVSKSFGGLSANAEVSFSVERGSIVGLIGPNGAGKTTLFNCITGYYPPSRGEILFKGQRVDGRTPDQVCRLGMVRTWQKVRPLPKLSVLDNVMVGALARTFRIGVARELAFTQLQVVGLAHKSAQPAGSLSIGDRKRLELARALATQPELLLLDEVMGGLNPTETDAVVELLLQLKARGLTQVVVEHDMRAIMCLSDSIVVLNSGAKLAQGTPEQIARDPAVVTAYLGGP